MNVQPDKPSSTYAQMIADWQLVRAVRGGATAVRNGRQMFLPKFEEESVAEYTRRVSTAPFSAHYEDSARALLAKPFSKEVSLQGEVPDLIRAWCEDVDRAGNNLHTFAQTFFSEALHMGIGYVLVEYPNLPKVVSLAQERALRPRPYMRLIPVDEMLAIYDGDRNGASYVRQIRFRENTMTLDGLDEVVVERIRIVEDIEGEIRSYTYTKEQDGWVESDPIVYVGMTEIPIVPLSFGLQIGGRFTVKPTLLDLAQKQIDHYRHANRLNEIFDFAGFPMLQAKGMTPPMETFEMADGTTRTEPKEIKVGPRTILFAPASQEGSRPEWSFVEPSAQTIKEVREHLRDIESEMRTLGLQPMMPSAGIQNMAATTSAINVARTHSAVQAWALRTKDALEQALVYMARWARLPETAEVYVHTDFSAEVLADADEKLLLEALTLGHISRETWFDEMSRRGILGPQFDPKREAQRIEDAADGLGMPSHSHNDNDMALSA